MAVYFFDSSALVKRHVNETGSVWVRSLTRIKAGHTLYIARITAVEITSAITRRQRGRYLSTAQAGAILGHFRRHLTHRYAILEMTPSLLADAMLLARAHGLRAYDAVQLAAALEVNRIYQTGSLGPVTLVSADQPLNAAAQVKGMAVEDPNVHP
jgi:predicted nucleic acid-binding protein